MRAAVILMRDGRAEECEDAVGSGSDDEATIMLYCLDHQLQCRINDRAASSGSRSSMGSVEPLISPNNAVALFSGLYGDLRCRLGALRRARRA